MATKRRRWAAAVAVTLGGIGAAGVVGCSSDTPSATPTGAPSGATTTAASGTPTSGTPASGAPPVSLSGTVDDHGTTDLSSAGSSVDLSLEADDNYFGPTFIQVAPGATVHVEIENEGTRDHTFTVDAAGVDATLGPGAKATVDVPVPASGNVAFYCRIHRSTGMQGSFFTAAATGGATATTARATPPTTAASSGRDGY